MLYVSTTIIKMSTHASIQVKKQVMNMVVTVIKARLHMITATEKVIGLLYIIDFVYGYIDVIPKHSYF